MNKEKVRLVIQNTLKTGLALVGVAFGAAIVAASRERLKANKTFKRIDSDYKESVRIRKNARRRELAAQKRALVKDLRKAGYSKV